MFGPFLREENFQAFMDAAKIEVKDVGLNLVSLYCKLSALSFDFRKRLWKMTPTCHLFLELCEVQMPMMGNGRYWWTYADEDLVGQLIDIAEGLHPRTMPEILLVKWLLLCLGYM